MSERSSSTKNWSIITVTYNSSAALLDNWAAWQPAHGIEWIVVDNHSSDNSTKIARRFNADSIISLNENIGFGRANNIGIQESKGNYLLFANPDLEVKTGDLDRIASYIDKFQGLVSPQLLYKDGTLQPNGRGFPTIQNKIVNRILFGKNSRYRLFGELGTTRPVCFLMGASIAGSRRTILELDGWDERFFVYYEDSDICLREWLRGGHVELLSEIEWRHGWARATLGFKFRPWLLEIKSAIRFYNKYPILLWGESIAAKAFPQINQAVFGNKNSGEPRRHDRHVLPGLACRE